HETWVAEKAPDFFAAVRQQGLRPNRVTRCSNWIFFELAQSGGSEQNSVSIALKPLCDGTFFKVWSGADQEKVNQINSLSATVERLKI
ncbi:MAG: hypothetical protein ACKOCU_01865, partial [Betaproteobacteria bacterium]